MASVGRTEDRIVSNLSSASGRGLPQVTQGEYRGTPQLGSTIRFSHQWEICLVSGGKNPEVLSEADHAFIIRTISGMTPLNLMELGGTGSRSSVRDSE